MDYEKILYNEIGKKIKKRRKELGITQDKLAEITNYSFSFIANIEGNTYQSFSISALNNIAKALNTTMKKLLPDEVELKTDYLLNCEYCKYSAEIPKEIFKLLHSIKDISNKQIPLSCPKCHKKIMF